MFIIIDLVCVITIPSSLSLPLTLLPTHTDVTPPATYKLTMAEVYNKDTSKPQPEVLKKHFIQEGRLEEDVALRIINEGSSTLLSFHLTSCSSRNGGSS